MTTASARHRTDDASSPRGLLVVGPHRSGTSATARVLSLMGANLPDHRMAPRSDDNETGFWESRELVSISDDVLAIAGSAWHYPTALPEGFFAAKALEPLRERALGILRRELGESNLFVLKDPRFCRLLPFWLPVVHKLGATPNIVLVVRNPLEVAASLGKRDDMPFAAALLLWLRHVLEAERHSRHCPRSILSYHRLLSDWPSAIARITQDLAISWPTPEEEVAAEVDGFLSPELCHHHATLQDLLDRTDVSPRVRTAFTLLNGYAQDGRNERRLISGLDQVAAELEHASGLTDGRGRAKPAPADWKQDDETGESGALTKLAAELAAMYSELQAALADRDQRLATNALQIHELQDELADKARQLAAHALRIQGLSADMQMQKTLLAAASQELRRAQTLHHSQLEQHIGAFAKLDTEMGRCAMQLAARTAEARTLAARVAALERESWSVRGRLARHVAGWRTRPHGPGAGSAPSAEVKRIAASPLFREVYYRSQHSELADPAVNAAQHYLQRGASLGLNPHPLFDAAFFVAQIPGLAESGSNPLLYYLEHGARLPASPHPLFDPQFYLRTNPDVAAAEVNPLEHFLEFGHASYHPRAPHPLFDTAYYLRTNPDVARSGENPLVHFVQFGGTPKHPRNPHPLFDSAYYLRRNPDVAAAGNSPLVHFLQLGDADHHRRQPHPLFDNDHYLRYAPEAIESGINSLVHFLRHCAADPHPLFDCDYYLRQNPGLAAAGANPLLHYLAHATTEPKPQNPHPLFDTGYYLRVNPDVAKAGVNPLTHFVTFGGSAEEQRNPHPLFDARYYLSHNQHAADGPLGAVLHFLKHGSIPGFLTSPHPLFDPVYYLRGRSDLPQAAAPALLDLLVNGPSMRADPHALFASSYYRAQLPGRILDDTPAVCHYIEHWTEFQADPHPLFDTGYYLSQDPEPLQARINPLVHFLTVGAARGKDPCPLFSVSFYRQNYPRVTAAGHNPLTHFAQLGSSEGCRPIAPFDPQRMLANLAAGAPLTIGLLEECVAGDTGESFAQDSARHAEVIVRLRTERDRPQVKPALPPMLVVESGDEPAALATLQIPAAPEPVVSILLPVYNQLPITVECICSLVGHTDLSRHEIVIIDDCSEPAVGELLSSVAHVRYLRNEVNSGFLLSTRRAAEVARGQFLLLLNNDTQVTPGWLDALLLTFQQVDRLGAVGPKLVYPDGLLQEAGAKVHRDGATRLIGNLDDPSKPRYNYLRPVDYCSGACLLLRREVYQQIGGLDPVYAPAYYEDVELCLRLRQAGYQIVYNPAAVVIHRLGVTSDKHFETAKRENVPRNRNTLVERWQTTLEELDIVKLICFCPSQFCPTPQTDCGCGPSAIPKRAVAAATFASDGGARPGSAGEQSDQAPHILATMEQQAHLARAHGIYGLCYSAGALQDLGLETAPGQGLPFCLAWTREDWMRWRSRNAPGGPNLAEGAEALIAVCMGHFHSPRYIRVGGRPLFLVDAIPLAAPLRPIVESWRALCRREGVGEIYLAAVETSEPSLANHDPRRLGFDAAVELPRRRDPAAATPAAEDFVSRLNGHDCRTAMVHAVSRAIPGYPRFRSVLPHWNDSSRQKMPSTSPGHLPPSAYRAWLESAVDDVRIQNFGDERLVFINALCPWPEGDAPETARDPGHNYLQAVKDVLSR